MRDVSRQSGRTVLFVSHNMQAVSTLTTRCLLMREGRKVVDGPTNEVIAAYLDAGLSRETLHTAASSATSPSITRVEVHSSEPQGTQRHGHPIRFVFHVTTPVRIRAAAFSFQILDSLMQPVMHMWIFDSEKPFGRAPGTYRLTCHIPRLRLYMGRYSVTAHLSDGYPGSFHDGVEGVCPFEVVMHGHEREWPWQEGACHYLEEGSWEVTTESTGSHAPSAL